MPILQIDTNYVTDFDKFQWGKEFRAERIWRELRSDGEYLFASMRRNYGNIDEVGAIDLGTKKEDYWWIGREEDRVGERVFDTNPRSDTFGQRKYEEPPTIVEEQFNEETQKWEKVSYKDGRLIYKYRCPATDDFLKKFQSLVGNLDNGKTTQLIFIFGSRVVDIPNPDVFFAKGSAVGRFEQEYLKKLNSTPEESQAEMIAKILESLANKNDKDKDKKKQ